MLYGVSYYPEQKTKSELKHDIELLVQSGINTVRMGEFAWCRLEPREGEFHFEWLDEVIKEIGKEGIKTIVCTPTACPPAWLAEKYPSLLYMDNRRIRRPVGGRRHYCYNNEDYRHYSAVITEKIAEHYGRNPNVAGFQIDNEPAQEGTGRCACPVCEEKFRRWLEKKYKTVEEFNRRSGSIFWSQEYTGFHQISIPVNSIEPGAKDQINSFYENPALRLDFERFSSESQIEYQNIQTKILKKYTDYPVTTNATGLATNSIDYYGSTKELDCYAFDYYPNLRNARVDSFPYAFARGVKEGNSFWVLEFMSGGGHRLGGSGRLQPNPGALKQAVVQAFACGASLLLHFQFRSFPYGAEQLNYAIVDLDGVPGRRYFEMQETAKLLKKLEPVSNAVFENEVAVCLNYDVHWALRIKPVNDPEFNYLDYCRKLYGQFAEAGVNADVISYGQDFSKYKVVVLPAAIILPESMRRKIKKYAENGGTVVCTFLTSVKNEDNAGDTQSLPAGLTDLFGISVKEVEPVFAVNHTEVKLNLEENGVVLTEDNLWSELLAGPAKMLGIYQDTFKEGEGVVSVHSYGKGRAYYIGTDLGETGALSLIEKICRDSGVTVSPVTGNKNLEIIHRVLDHTDIYFAFNFSQRPEELSLKKEARDYITGERHSRTVTLQPNDFKIMQIFKN